MVRSSISFSITKWPLVKVEISDIDEFLRRDFELFVQLSDLDLMRYHLIFVPPGQVLRVVLTVAKSDVVLVSFKQKHWQLALCFPYVF